LELELETARRILEGGGAADMAVSLERGRLAIYAGDYDAAATLLRRSDLLHSEEGASLEDIAQGCARGMAATLEVRDDAHGVVLRLQDDDDRVLAPMLANVAARVREQLAADLGVELPKPLRIDVVRDQLTLAAMTGLPERAAQTTGTVAVAKWGRVTMISPRATPHGYPWLDTLAHEMTHLALSRGTRDHAPLWLQEGVAKLEEKRWRERQPLDDVPPVDDVSQMGFEKGFARPLNQLGPSVAMLPTATEAAVAFAEVSSFLQYFIATAGREALPRLVLRLKTASSSDDVDAALKEISSNDLAAWNTKWRASISERSGALPPDLVPGAVSHGVSEVVRNARLGELYAERGHSAAAALRMGRAQKLAPADGMLRAVLAAALESDGQREKAASLVEKPHDLHSASGRWWSLHGTFFPDPAQDADRSFALGVSLDPYAAEVACEERLAPGLPSDAFRRALCEADRAPAVDN
jgi:hypothetical protein